MKWLFKTWPKVGGIGGIGLLAFLISNWQIMGFHQKAFWTHLILLLFHQFEEYVFPGKFKRFFNEYIYPKTPIFQAPLNDYSVLIVNVVIAWPAFLYSALHPELIWLAMALLFITLVNGALHTFLFILYRKYNPGLVTGFFLFIPFSLFAILKISPELTAQGWKTAIFVAIIGHAMIPLGIYLSGQFQRD